MQAAKIGKQALTPIAVIYALLRLLFHAPGDILKLEKLKDAVFGQFWLIIGKSEMALNPGLGFREA